MPPNPDKNPVCSILARGEVDRYSALKEAKSTATNAKMSFKALQVLKATNAGQAGRPRLSWQRARRFAAEDTILPRTQRSGVRKRGSSDERETDNTYHEQT